MGSRRSFFLLISLSLLILLSLSGCSNGNGTRTKAAGSEKALPVRAVAVESRQVRRTVESVGSLFAYDEVVVSSEVDGRVEKVLADVGDHVTKGQALVEVLPIEYKLSAEQHEAILQQVRAKLGLADGEPDLKDPRDSASVKKAAADLANAQQKFQRTKELTAQGLVPKQTYDQDEASYKAAQATYELALQDVRNLQASMKEQETLRDLANKKLRDTRILAPFDGYIKDRNVTVGQYLKASSASPSPVFTIVNVDPIRVRLKVPEKMAAWIPVNQMVSVSVEAYPDRTFSGKISRINPSVDTQTRTFEAEALIENHQGLLKPGFFVKANIQSTKMEPVLYVPQKALSYAYGIYKVYALQGDKVKEKEVRIGDRTSNEVEIVEGLSEGERLAVAVKDQDEFKDRALVQIVP